MKISTNYGLQNNNTNNFEPKVWSKKKQWIFVAVILGIIIAVFTCLLLISQKNNAEEAARKAEENARKEAYHKIFKNNEDQFGNADDCSKLVCLTQFDDEDTYCWNYIPEELVAQSAEEVAIVVRFKKDRILKGVYKYNSNGNQNGYQVVYIAEWYDVRMDDVVAREKFYGGEPPFATTGGLDQYGTPPEDAEILEWIKNTYQSVFEDPYIDVATEDLHLVIPAGFSKNEDGSYQDSEIIIDPYIQRKDEISIQTMEEFLTSWALVLETVDGMTDVSEVQYNKNGIPYYIYKQETTKTELLQKYTYNYVGIFAIYETDNSFYTVDFVCLNDEFSTEEEAVSSFVKWSELCFISK